MRLPEGVGMHFFAVFGKTAKGVLEGRAGTGGRLRLGDLAADLSHAPESLLTHEARLVLINSRAYIAQISLLDEQSRQRAASGIVGEVGHQSFAARVGTAFERGDDRSEIAVLHIDLVEQGTELWPRVGRMEEEHD